MEFETGRVFYFTGLSCLLFFDCFNRQVRSVEDISSGYSSTEFLASDPNVGVDAAAGTIPRRSGSIRAARSATRPVTVVLEGANTRGKPTSDVRISAFLPVVTCHPSLDEAEHPDVSHKVNWGFKKSFTAADCDDPSQRIV